MKRFVVVAIAVVLALPVLAAEPAKAGAQDENPMHGWVPRKVKNEAADRKEIQAFFKRMENASKTGDVEAAAALVDFPVTMITDDSQGQAGGDTWTREKWIEVMKPFYAKPNPEMRMTHKATIHVVSDSLASVYDEFTMSAGKQQYGGRSAMLLIRRDGKWLAKTMMEGGWGDMMKEHPTASGASGSTETGTGSGAESGTGHGTGMGSPTGTGTGTGSSSGMGAGGSGSSTGAGSPSGTPGSSGESTPGGEKPAGSSGSTESK
jgi:hypothetical protein